MRILAFGDLHLGASPDLGRVPFGEGSRLHDQARVLNRIANLAHEEDVELCLFSGDAFHRRRPTPSEILTWRRFVDRLNTQLGVAMIAIDGNHDVEAADRPSALEILRGHAAYETSRIPAIFHPTPQLAVATLPWTPPAHLLASLNGDVPRDEVNARVAELLIDSARDLRTQIPEGKTAILLAHWSVSGSSLPNGLPVEQLRDPVLPLPDLEALLFDFVVLSHIHKGQILGNPEGGIFYTGSPALVDFGEAKTEHGVWIIDTEAGLNGNCFHPIEERRFLTIECDLTLPGGGDDLTTGGALSPSTIAPAESVLDETDLVAAAISEQLPLTDAVVRVRYRCTAEQARHVDVAALRGFMHEAGVSKIFSLAPIIEREDRARVEGVDESLTTMDALDAYLKSEAISPDKANELRRKTAEYLETVAA